MFVGSLWKLDWKHCSRFCNYEQNLIKNFLLGENHVVACWPSCLVFKDCFGGFDIYGNQNRFWTKKIEQFFAPGSHFYMHRSFKSDSGQLRRRDGQTVLMLCLLKFAISKCLKFGTFWKYASNFDACQARYNNWIDSIIFCADYLENF